MDCIESIKNKRIGFSVLNWGLGHVTRSVSIIHQLKTQSNQVFIFCNDEQKNIFSQYLLDVSFIDHEGYPFKFRGKGNFKRDLFRSLFALYTHSKLENRLCEKYVISHNLDLLISDQRYGFYSTKVPSIFITHQLKFPLKGVYRIFNKINKHQILKFGSVWVVDNKINLAGKLSINQSFKNCFNIGHHSRFLLLQKQVSKDINSVLIVNGPFSYSDYLIDHFSKELESNKIEYVIGGVHVSGLLSSVDTRAVFVPNTSMNDADVILSRTKEICGYFGYSTLMDCRVLCCSFNLIPTPGQLEQIYLSKLHKKSS
ncbi:MAG: hypothetical protein HOH34_07450 [Flavobacteriales bacterium]|nr:hypothetical protein [Flavobacteriales bacterium]MBT5933160.1 hypothetical protein [Flavobacteriales bacterium]MDA7761945.1 hypothetical protein [Crocinitomicaceae bacterium]